MLSAGAIAAAHAFTTAASSHWTSGTPIFSTRSAASGARSSRNVSQGSTCGSALAGGTATSFSTDGTSIAFETWSISSSVLSPLSSSGNALRSASVSAHFASICSGICAHFASSVLPSSLYAA